MDDFAELDISLEKVEQEIDDLRDRIDFLQRRKDGIMLSIERNTDPKETERLETVKKQLDEDILKFSIQLDHRITVADEIGRALRKRIGLEPDRDPPTSGPAHTPNRKIKRKR